MNPEITKIIGKRWSDRSNRPSRVRWWESATIRRHVSKKIIPGGTENGYWYVEAIASKKRHFKNALSIGCGTAIQEIALLASNLVDHFDLFELAPQMIMDAEEGAKKAGVRDRINFHFGDFFTSTKNKPESYDLVFWSASLHHMFDVNQAVAVTKDNLVHGGVFYCNEFVGANNFQYSTLEIMIANGVRTILPPSVFKIPGTDREWQVAAGRPNLEEMKKIDPSEAADSENIVPAIKKYFPNAEIIPLGGVVYNLALMDILTNIPEDCGLLNDLLALDDEANSHGIYQYAFCMVEK